MRNWSVKYISACIAAVRVIPKSNLVKLFDRSIGALVLSDNVLCLLSSDDHGR